MERFYFGQENTKNPYIRSYCLSGMSVFSDLTKGGDSRERFGASWNTGSLLFFRFNTILLDECENATVEASARGSSILLDFDGEEGQRRLAVSSQVSSSVLLRFDGRVDEFSCNVARTLHNNIHNKITLLHN